MTPDADVDHTEPVAAIDVGTNTIRMLVARVAGGRVRPLASGSAMTALGAGLRAGGTVDPDALGLAELTVGRMAEEARELGAGRIALACTAPARLAADAEALLARLGRAAGVPARALTGIEEAELTFRGLVAAGAPDPLLAVDLGGASLELVGGSRGHARWATSLPIGTRTLTERFAPSDPPGIDLVEPMVAAAREVVDPVAAVRSGASAVVAGGSGLALAQLAGTDRLDRDALVRAVEHLVGAPASDVAERFELSPARVRLSLAGAASLEAVRRAFGLDGLLVSEAGLREGLVLELAS